MPLPLNQRTNRFCGRFTCPSRAGTSAAYAVPAELNIEMRGGTPVITGTCAAVSPRRKSLRDRRFRLVMICDIFNAPCEFRRFDQGHHEFSEMVTRFAK